MPNETSFDLSWSLKNSIVTNLTILDEALCEFEQWAQGREIRSVFYKEENELTPEEQEWLKSRVAEIRERLQSIKDTLKLQEKTHSAKTHMWGQCSVLWVNLVDLTSKHLKRYGALPPGLTEYLDPKVDELIELTNGISKLVRKT